MKIVDLLLAIQQVGDKASLLARTIRSEQALFELLIEEKTGNSKNKRFLKDFKTLADVLVQELVKTHLSKLFPGIVHSIYGEECNTFTNNKGEKVIIEIKDNAQEMVDLLVKILDGNHNAAQLLTDVVTSPYAITSNQHPELRDLDVPLENVGLWIDPIDSTAQYVHGVEGFHTDNGIYVEGLQCAVILIGAYNKVSGKPFLGLINQPFFNQDKTIKQWCSRSLWGVSYEDINISHVPRPVPEGVQLNKLTKDSVILSTSESSVIQESLKKHNSVVYAAGAGYKLTCVVDQLVSAYLLTKCSTFKWDTCAPHAILKSGGGNIVSYDKAKEFVHSNINASLDYLVSGIAKFEIQYEKPDREDLNKGEEWSNSMGVLAYLDAKTAVNLLKSINT